MQPKKPTISESSHTLTHRARKVPPLVTENLTAKEREFLAACQDLYRDKRAMFHQFLKETIAISRRTRRKPGRAAAA